MKLIGLTGGIASGKSTIAARLAAHGAVHLDADRLAREAVEPGTPALAEIRTHFGDEVITEAGHLDRERLAGMVFVDSARLAKLNSIVHPAVRRLAQHRIDEAVAKDPQAVVVYDVPLLVESGLVMPWDLVVVAHAPESVRFDRLVELRGMSPKEARNRIAQQASDEERLAIADIVIDTSGKKEDSLAQADALWAKVNAS